MELKKISDLYWMVSPRLFVCSVFLGVGTGLCYSALIPFVIYATKENASASSEAFLSVRGVLDTPTADLAKVFFVTCLTIILIKSISQILASYIAKKASTQHRISLYERIQKLSYIDLEKIGQARLINLLNVDIPNVSNAASSMPLIWTSIITVLGTLGYLAYLNVKVFLFVVVCLVFSIVTYQLPVWYGTKFYGLARLQYDRIQKGVSGLIFGAKELKLSRNKWDQFFNEELIGPEKNAMKCELKGSIVITFAENYGEIIAFLVIGIVVFYFPYMFPMTESELTGTVMALIYLTGPVAMILSQIGNVQYGKVSLNKIKNFYSELVSERFEYVDSLDDSWRSIRLENISFKYPDCTNEFGIHEVSAEFKRGEITFIVGGNGSGKSTLSKIISLHYHADSGKIYYGSQCLVADNWCAAREQVSTVYTDFFLFSKLYDTYERSEIERYLELLQLTGIVDVEQNRFSSVDLSDGQRKRLALLVCLLEDRAVYIFDEWAADQEPKFKTFFYKTIVPYLKSRDKLIIVISHDDRYFSCADQIIIMEQGAIREVKRDALVDVVLESELTT